jgi:hypothetical protein
MSTSSSRRLSVTATQLPVTSCQIGERTVAYQPGTLSQAIAGSTPKLSNWRFAASPPHLGTDCPWGFKVGSAGASRRVSALSGSGSALPVTVRLAAVGECRRGEDIHGADGRRRARVLLSALRSGSLLRLSWFALRLCPAAAWTTRWPTHSPGSPMNRWTELGAAPAADNRKLLS